MIHGPAKSTSFIHHVFRFISNMVQIPGTEINLHIINTSFNLIIFPHKVGLLYTQLLNEYVMKRREEEVGGGGDENAVVRTSVRGRMSGSAWIRAMTSHRMIPNANTSACTEGGRGEDEDEERHTKQEIRSC